MAGLLTFPIDLSLPVPNLRNSGKIQSTKKWDYSSWDCSGLSPDSLLIPDSYIGKPLRYAKVEK